jgi:glycosyltransferase involved in cell wall biosynthesis
MPERLDAIIRSWLPRTAVWLCDSEDTRNAFVATYGVEPSSTRVAPLGVDTERFHPDALPGERARLRTQLGLDRPYLLFVGAMVPRKDLGTLMSAFEEVADGTPDIDLVLAGNKTLRWASDWPKVQGWMQDRADLAHRVHVLNYVSADLLPVLYRQCEAVLITSLSEGFGLTLLEGFACGRPVIASRAGALPEVGRTAAYYGEPRDPSSFADAIRRALAAEDAARRNEEAATIVSEHTWRRTARMTLRAYRHAMEA